MNNVTKKNLRTLAKIYRGDFCYELTPEAFNLIIKCLIESVKVSDYYKPTLIREFVNEIITTDYVINSIID